MPVAAGVGIATAVAGIYGAHQQSQSTDNAAAIKAKSDAAALALATQQENTRKQEYDAQQALLQKQWDAQQQIRAPYRAAGANALSQLGNILGVNFGNGLTTPSGPTPSNPSTLGPTPQPNVLNPTQAGAVTTFNNGAATIQNALTQSPAGTMPTPPVTPPSTNPTDEAGILAALTKNYGDLGVHPTGSGTGPTDISYYAEKVKETGGLTPDNVNYWFGPSGRIATDLAKAKGGGTATKAPASAAGLSLAPPLLSTMPLGVNTPGYSPIIPISGLMGRGPYQ